MERESFVFYMSFYEALKDLPDETYVRLSKALCEYALHGVVPELEGFEKSIFIAIKPQIDANNKRYENGQKGGRPKKNPEEQPGSAPETSDTPTTMTETRAAGLGADSQDPAKPRQDPAKDRQDPPRGGCTATRTDPPVPMPQGSYTSRPRDSANSWAAREAERKKKEAERKKQEEHFEPGDIAAMLLSTFGGRMRQKGLQLTG